MEMTMSGKKSIQKAINPDSKGALKKKVGAKKQVVPATPLKKMKKK